MSPPTPARNADLPTGGSFLKEHAKPYAIGVIGGALVLTAFAIAGIDRRWFRLLVAVAMTGAYVWGRYDLRRAMRKDIATMERDDAEAYRLGYESSTQIIGNFYLVVVAWYWTKALPIPFQWSASAIAVVTLAAAVWHHRRYMAGVNEVPPVFTNEQEWWARVTEKEHRLQRNLYLGIFAIFALFGTLSFLLD
jgi:hypothetical protein